jgi:transposase-like protein
MEESAECMLVLIGATPEGRKELVGFRRRGRVPDAILQAFDLLERGLAAVAAQ